MGYTNSVIFDDSAGRSVRFGSGSVHSVVMVFFMNTEDTDERHRRHRLRTFYLPVRRSGVHPS